MEKQVGNKNLEYKDKLDIKYKKWDLIIKIVIPLATILLGIWQFFSQQEKQALENFKRDFWLKKFEIYSELCKSVSEVLVAADYSGDEMNKKDKELKIISWKATLVQDTIIDKALRDFTHTVDDYLVIEKDIDSKARIKLKEDLRLRGDTLMKLCKISLNSEKPAEK